MIGEVLVATLFIQDAIGKCDYERNARGMRASEREFGGRQAAVGEA